MNRELVIEQVQLQEIGGRNHTDEASALDDGQVMKLDTLYKNYMGLGEPKDAGLTRGNVDICLW